MMKTLLEQLKNRRLALGLKQKDMMLRIGISRQQYQHLESKGNPRLNTLELISKGLKSELMLIPVEKLSIIKTILEDDEVLPTSLKSIEAKYNQKNMLVNNPWGNILEVDE